MNATFYISSIVAILATAMVIGNLNAVHALLYLVVSLLAVALVLFTFGAPFAAALEVIIYAGAIMVLFLFVIMTLNLGPHAKKQESEWLKPKIWIGPVALVAILMAELIYILAAGAEHPGGTQVIGPRAVALSLFGPYVLAVELASILLLAGLVGAYHLGRRGKGARREGEII